MSEKQAKKDRKDFEERQQAFTKVIEEASVKYKVGIYPALQFVETGVIPMLKIIDEKPKYDHLTEEAKKRNEAEKKAGKKVVTTATPQLEV